LDPTDQDERREQGLKSLTQAEKQGLKSLAQAEKQGLKSLAQAEKCPQALDGCLS
jgi:hypothetical protein